MELEPLNNREHPLYMYYPDLVEDFIDVSWDESLAIDSVILPSDDSLTASFGRLSHTSALAGNRVSVSMSVAYSKYHIEVDDFAEFEDFKSKIKSISNSYVKLLSSGD